MSNEKTAPNVYEIQARIAAELKAPKGQYNAFGKYAYRSAEDIQEAVKPLLVKYGASLTLNTDVRTIGERYYITATAILTPWFEPFETIVCQAPAREPLDKKGMDDSQITGAAISYARKYALGGLFLIDDTKDADALNNGETAAKQPRKTAKRATANTNPPEQQTPPQNAPQSAKDPIIEAVKKCMNAGIKADGLQAFFATRYGIQSLKEPGALNGLDERQRNECLAYLHQLLNDKKTLAARAANGETETL